MRSAGGPELAGPAGLDLAGGDGRLLAERREALLAAMPDLLFLFDAEGVILDYQAARRWSHHLPPPSARGRRLSDVLPAEVAEAGLAAIRDTLATGETQVITYQLTGSAGPRDYEARHVVSGPGEVLALIRDVTEQRRAEVALRESEQQLRAAVAARDTFLSVAAHELKTPMTSLRAYAQILGRGLDGGPEPPDPQFRRRALEAIDLQTAKLDRLVSQLLEVSRLQSGQLALETCETDVAALVAAVVAAAGVRAPGRSISLQAPPVAVAVVDPLRLEQVLANLLDNACKYSPAPLPIEVALDEPAAGTLRLSVRDYGPGIPPTNRERIFDRFFRAHGDSHASGMGVGLYVARQVVELHNGRIEAEFPPDGGCRFVVSLPVEPAPAPSAVLSTGAVPATTS